MGDDAGKKQTAQSSSLCAVKPNCDQPDLTGEPAVTGQGQTAKTKEQNTRRLGNGGVRVGRIHAAFASKFINDKAVGGGAFCAPAT